MAPEKFEATDDSVKAAFESRQLVGAIFSYANSQNNDLREVCIRLHNAKIIDLLGLVHNTEFESMNGQGVLVDQRLYCSVLPKLDAPVAAMMNCIAALAGNGSRAGFPHESLKQWCESDLSRAREIISGSRDAEGSSKEFLTVALIAGNYDREAREFIQRYSDSRRLSGLFALGKISNRNLPDANDALVLLNETISNHADDTLYTNVLSATFDIVNGVPHVERELLLKIVRRICDKSSPAVRDGCAQVLLHHPNELKEDVLQLLFGALILLAPSEKQSLKTLDFALSQLPNGDHADGGINFLQKFLLLNSEHLALSDFDSFEYALKSNPRKLQEVLVSWMLTAEGALCAGAASLFRNGEDEPFNFDISVAHLSTTHQIFLCRKIVGYLFAQATVACSFLVCILRQSNDEVAEAVSRLLFDPILRSYAGKPKAYLYSIPADDKAFARVQPALLKAEKYISDINSIGEIEELHPAESARQTVSLRDFDEMQEARKAAEKDSVFLNLVTRSTVLHGQRTLTYFEDDDRDREPMEIELHPHSIEFEMPRQEVLDPIGIDYTLRVLRAERLKS